MQIHPLIIGPWPQASEMAFPRGLRALFEAKPGSQKFRTRFVWKDGQTKRIRFWHKGWHRIETLVAKGYEHPAVVDHIQWVTNFDLGRHYLGHLRRIHVLEHFIATDVLDPAGRPIRPYVNARRYAAPPDSPAQRDALITLWPKTPLPSELGSRHAQISLMAKLEQDVPMLERLSCAPHERMSCAPHLIPSWYRGELST